MDFLVQCENDLLFFENRIKTSSSNDFPIDLLNRGTLFGESIFTSFATYKGRLLFLDDHLNRLKKSVKFLWDWTSNNEWSRLESQIKQGVSQLLESAILQTDVENYIRITLFLENFPVTLVPESGKVRFFVYLTPTSKTKFNNPVSITVSPYFKQEHMITPPFLKTGCFSSRVLDLRWAQKSACDDVLYLTESGHVAECTTSNIFFKRGELIFTSKLSSCVLDGVLRKNIILCLNNDGYKVEIGDFNIDELKDAEEVWITNAVKGVRPVKSIIHGDQQVSFESDKFISHLRTIFNRYCDENK